MKTKNLLLSSMLSITILLTACGGTPAPDAMIAKETPTADAMMRETPTVEAVMGKESPTAEAMMKSPNWYSASFTDARSGQAFKIDDFKGKVVLVETMAVWCPKCNTQQSEIKALHAKLGDTTDLVSISLDIDPNEDSGVLGNYVLQTGFDWFYAVAPAEVSQEIASLYGDQFLNPPSTPILVIDRHGEAHPLPFGIKSADELLQFIQPFLDEAM